MARTAKQRAASRKNLEKARAARKTSGGGKSGIAPSFGSTAAGKPNKTSGTGLSRFLTNDAIKSIKNPAATEKRVKAIQSAWKKKYGK